MSAAAAAEAPPPKGKKKLIIIVVAVLVLLLGGAGAFLMMSKKKAANEEAESDGGAKTVEKAPAAKANPGTPPVFVPLEPFTVNLADRDAERYAQVAVTLEVVDAKLEAQIKLFMPAVRNNILLALADRKAGELLEREGKTQLAERIKRETSRALGFEVEEPSEEAAEEEDPPAKKPGKKKKKKVAPELPIRAVHFSNFIIQ